MATRPSALGRGIREAGQFIGQGIQTREERIRDDQEIAREEAQQEFQNELAVRGLDLQEAQYDLQKGMAIVGVMQQIAANNPEAEIYTDVTYAIPGVQDALVSAGYDPAELAKIRLDKPNFEQIIDLTRTEQYLAAGDETRERMRNAQAGFGFLLDQQVQLIDQGKFRKSELQLDYFNTLTNEDFAAIYGEAGLPTGIFEDITGYSGIVGATNQKNVLDYLGKYGPTTFGAKNGSWDDERVEDIASDLQENIKTEIKDVNGEVIRTIPIGRLQALQIAEAMRTSATRGTAEGMSQIVEMWQNPAYGDVVRRGIYYAMTSKLIPRLQTAEEFIATVGAIDSEFAENPRMRRVMIQLVYDRLSKEIQSQLTYKRGYPLVGTPSFEVSPDYDPATVNDPNFQPDQDYLNFAQALENAGVSTPVDYSGLDQILSKDPSTWSNEERDTMADAYARAIQAGDFTLEDFEGMPSMRNRILRRNPELQPGAEEETPSPNGRGIDSVGEGVGNPVLEPAPTPEPAPEPAAPTPETRIPFRPGGEPALEEAPAPTPESPLTPEGITPGTIGDVVPGFDPNAVEVTQGEQERVASEAEFRDNVVREEVANVSEIQDRKVRIETGHQALSNAVTAVAPNMGNALKKVMADNKGSLFGVDHDDIFDEILTTLNVPEGRYAAYRGARNRFKRAFNARRFARLSSDPDSFADEIINIRDELSEIEQHILTLNEAEIARAG